MILDQRIRLKGAMRPNSQQNLFVAEGLRVEAISGNLKRWLHQTDLDKDYKFAPENSSLRQKAWDRSLNATADSK
jgi:hypothetical protein